MPLVSITRLCLHHVGYLVPFFIDATRSSNQAQRARGYRGGFLAGERWLGFWTATMWDDEAAMRAYRNDGAHLRAMKKLLGWCDEASYAHWEASELPTVEEMHRRMLTEGKLSKVRRPSARHRDGKTAGDRIPRRARELPPL